MDHNDLRGHKRGHGRAIVNPRDLQTGPSRGSLPEANAVCQMLQAAGIACEIYQFPEFQGLWWATCVVRASQLKRAKELTAAFDAGSRHATSNRGGS